MWLRRANFACRDTLPGFLLIPGMRRTLQPVPGLPGDNPLHGGRDRAPLAPGAGRDLRLPAVDRGILAQWARDKCPQQAAALAFQTALSLVPVTAIAFSILRARRLARRRVAPPAVLLRARLPANVRRHRADPVVPGQGQHRRARAAAASSSPRHLLLALQLRRADLQRHLAGRAAPHADRQVPDLLRDGHAAADAGGVLALLVGAADRVGRRDALLRAVADRARWR